MKLSFVDQLIQVFVAFKDENYFLFHPLHSFFQRSDFFISLFFALVVRLCALKQHPLVIDDVIASVMNRECLAPRQS